MERAPKFFIEFAKYASRVAYDDCSLRRIAYKALPARIKDRLAEITPTPRTFNELKAVVLSLDAHYWEYKKEKAATNAPPTSQKPHNNSGNGGNSGGRSSKTTQPKRTSSTVPGKIAIVLGKDGKLLPEEKQRQIDNGLCLICAEKGHMAQDCPKSRNNSTSANKTQAKGRAAKADKAESTPGPSGSKN